MSEVYLPQRAGKRIKPQRHIEMNLCVFVVFDLRWMIGNQINSFAAYLLCEKKKKKLRTNYKVKITGN